MCVNPQQLDFSPPATERLSHFHFGSNELLKVSRPTQRVTENNSEDRGSMPVSPSAVSPSAELTTDTLFPF